MSEHEFIGLMIFAVMPGAIGLALALIMVLFPRE